MCLLAGEEETVGQVTPIPVELIADSLYCSYEWGGAYSRRGECEIWTDSDGHPKVGLPIPQSKNRPNRKHALIPIQVGDYAIWVKHNHNHKKIPRFSKTTTVKTVCRIPPHFRLTIHRVKKLYVDVSGFAHADLEEITYYYNLGEYPYTEEWEIEPSSFFGDAILMAVEKASKYHCYEPYYIQQESANK